MKKENAQEFQKRVTKELYKRFSTEALDFIYTRFKAYKYNNTEICKNFVEYKTPQKALKDLIGNSGPIKEYYDDLINEYNSSGNYYDENEVLNSIFNDMTRNECLSLLIEGLNEKNSRYNGIYVLPNNKNIIATMDI